MKTKCPADISPRPLSITVERKMTAAASALYVAWCHKFDQWFAEPGEIMMVPEVDRPYFFKNRRDWGSHPHYGRFLELERDKVVEMTWITGKGGTEGAETVVRVELTPVAGGTSLRLTHSGFKDDVTQKAHRDNWPEGLATLDECLKKV